MQKRKILICFGFVGAIIFLGLVFYLLMEDHFSIWAPIISLVGGVITSFIQIYKIYKNRGARSISLLKTLGSFGGCLGWLGYSLEINNVLMTTTFFIVMILSVVMIGQYIYYEIADQLFDGNWTKYL